MKITKIYSKKVTAAPVPLSDEQALNMANQGIYVVPNIIDKLKAGKKEIASAISQSGLTDFVANLNIQQAISIPAIIKNEPSKLVKINGKEYYVVDVTESKQKKGENIPGEILLMDISTGLPVTVGYDEYRDSIEKVGNKPEIAAKVNKEIALWNSKVEKLQQATGLTRLNLQIFSAIDKIKERVQTLDGQITSLDKEHKTPEAYSDWVAFLEDGVKTKKFSPRDTYDTLLFLYGTYPDELISKIESGEIMLDSPLKELILAVAGQESKSVKEDKEKALKNKQDRKDSIDEPMDGMELEDGLYEGPLSEISVDSVPDSKYVKPDKYKNIHTLSASVQRALENIRTDRSELLSVKSALETLAQEIAKMPPGAKKFEALSGKGGDEIKESLQKFLHDVKSFLRRYKTPVVDASGQINTALFGRMGTMGNAFLAVDINKIAVIINKNIKEINYQQSTVEKF